MTLFFYQSIDQAINTFWWHFLHFSHFKNQFWDIPKIIAFLLGDTFFFIDRSQFGDTLSVSASQKIDFGTFQLGIAQLVPRVSGSPSPLPPPRPQTSRKKKKVPNPPPRPLPSPYWLEIDGSDRKKYPSVTKRPLEFRRATKPLGELNFLPGAGPRAR